MSIDALVTVYHYEDGSGRLGLSGENRGVKELSYKKAPYEVTSLNGLQIWGDSNKIYLGEKKIADRDSYTTITFVDDISFRNAVREYKEKYSQ